jgi:hypothetical protein
MGYAVFEWCDADERDVNARTCSTTGSREGAELSGFLTQVACAGFLPVVNCADRNRLISPNTTSWDVANDFSNSCNPTGQWSYGATPALGGGAAARMTANPTD